MGFLKGFFDSLSSLAEDDPDYFPGIQGKEHTEGVLGAIRQMGKGIEDLGIDMSTGTFDRSALDQLLKSGTITKKEHARLMDRVRQMHR